jgi:uncharacterized protein (TIGR02246 family)
MNNNHEEIGRTIIAELERGWNAADGPGFARPFTTDADFVDIRGAFHHGREAIGHGHQAIFESVYRGSRIAYTLEQVRALADGVILLHSTAVLDTPSGPLAGQGRAIQSMVLVREGEEWKIASFQNTMVMPPPGGGAH